VTPAPRDCAHDGSDVLVVEPPPPVPTPALLPVLLGLLLHADIPSAQAAPAHSVHARRRLLDTTALKDLICGRIGRPVEIPELAVGRSLLAERSLEG
jgi:hypothetical protein